MAKGRSSDTLYWQLMREGLKPKTVGAVMASNERAGVCRLGDGPQVTAATPGGRGDVSRNGVRLVWINPAMTKRARSRARLVMIE